MMLKFNIKKMKKYFFVFFIGLTAFLFMGNAKCFGQHNLAFTQVLLVTSTEDTVPAGHVWKINSFLPSNDIVPTNNPGSGNSHTTVSFCIKVGGTTVYVGGSYSAWTYGSAIGSSGSTGCGTMLTDPLWLPEGTRLAAFTNVRYVSVTEFAVQ